MIDAWQEIADTIRTNKLRTLLTGFSVAWGIFMLVVLLGSGKGLENGIAYQFRDDASNSIWVRSGETAVPHRGLPPGRRVRFTNADTDEARRVDGVDHLTARFYFGNPVLSHGQESGTFDVRSVHPDHRYLENTIMKEGRFLDPLDVAERRKVAVLGVRVVEALFKDGPAVGRDVTINGVSFVVIGVFDDEGGDSEREKVYVPISTAQRTFGGRDRVDMFMFTTGTAPLARTEAMSATVKRALATRHRFSADDDRAVSMYNNNEMAQRFVNLMHGIRMFTWALGIGTILAGVVGVSNIMMIAVRERTREIGVRKALGATPWSIVGSILQESILVTGVAGYTGLVAGVAVLELVAAKVPGAEFFRNPEIDMQVAVNATLLLIVAGAVAGLIPARRAASIRPVEALRDE